MGGLFSRNQRSLALQHRGLTMHLALLILMLAQGCTNVSLLRKQQIETPVVATVLSPLSVTPPVPASTVMPIPPAPPSSDAVVKAGLPPNPPMLLLNSALTRSRKSESSAALAANSPDSSAKLTGASVTDLSLPALPVATLLGTTSGPPVGFFMPSGLFGKSVEASKAAPVTNGKSISLDPVAVAVPAPLMPAVTPVKVVLPNVLIYASGTTRAYFSAGGLDDTVSVRTWENFLRKYAVPFEVTASVDRLEKSSARVLVLPSSVALSEREKQAVIRFRGKGGSVLASWLSGVRNEYGEWRGFGFMENVLDTKVVGNTEAEKDVTFLMPYGDNPVTHRLPAGLRIWLERAPEWSPLRLVGRQTAAQFMDWSRDGATGKAGGAIVYDERKQPSGLASRVVVFGYAERLWESGDSNALESIALDAMKWLLRQPDAYTGAWPFPYKSAFTMAVDVADFIADTDAFPGEVMAELGGKATYFVLTEQAEAGATLIKKIQASGHEIAYLGDRFEGFSDESTAAQTNRFDTMASEMEAAGIDVGTHPGFHAPMESYDKKTEILLQRRGFGYYVADPGASAARLPFLVPPEPVLQPAPSSPSYLPTPSQGLVVLPRTQNGPEDLMMEGNPSNAMKTFLHGLTLSEDMAALVVVRLPSQNSLTKAHWGEIKQHLKAQRGNIWLASGEQVATWWRERDRVLASLDATVTPPILTVTIKGDQPLQQPATVLVNLPEYASVLRLVAERQYEKSPKISSIDIWRSAVVLDGLSPGQYRWYLYFDRP